MPVHLGPMQVVGSMLGMRRIHQDTRTYVHTSMQKEEFYFIYTCIHMNYLNMSIPVLLGSIGRGFDTGGTGGMGDKAMVPKSAEISNNLMQPS